MELLERQKRYRAIEEYRKRPLIVYATSTRTVATPQGMGVSGSMQSDTVREFIDQVDAIPPDQRAVDILVHSTGGDPLAAWKLMSLIRERFEHVAVLVPFMAFSAATLFALGADEIIMHPHASLGPIDPQITLPQKDGQVRRFAYEDVTAFLRFLKTDVKIEDQPQVATVSNALFSTVDPVFIGGAKRASELSADIGERLLLTHMKSQEDKTRARQIAENLNKSFFAHGDAVSRTRARELNLAVAKEDTDLEKLMWEAFAGLESYMEFRLPFVPLQVYLSNPLGAAALRPVAPISLPSNAPPQLVQQVWQTAFQTATQNLTAAAVEVPYRLINAVVESVRIASEYRTEGRLSAFRTQDGQVRMVGNDTYTRWGTVIQPQPAQPPVQQNPVPPSSAT
jgi:hypothetical protein